MSTSFRQFRKSSTAQGRFKDLVSDYQRFVAEQVTVTNPDFRVKSRVMHSKMVYHDPLLASKSKGVTQAFYMPFEPDGKYVVAMYDVDHNGRFLKDGSGYGHHGRFQNNPELKQGIDRGFGASTYAHFDGFHRYAYVDNYSPLRLSMANHFSITCTIYPKIIIASDSYPLPGGTKFRTILAKPDTTWPDNTKAGQIDGGSVGNGYHLAVTPGGKIRFTLMKDGVRYTIETLSGIITAADPPNAYDITVTVDQANKKTIPAELVSDPGDIPEADPDAEPLIKPPLIAPNMQISVNDRFFQLYTTEHLPFVDDPTRRLRIASLYPFQASQYPWFKFVGGIQQIRLYKDYLLTFPEIQNLYENKQTIRHMPFGSAAHAGSILAFELLSEMIGGYDPDVYDLDGFELGTTEFGIYGFPGFDPLGFDNFGFDVAPINAQGQIQNGGFDPRGFSGQGYHVLPDSQS